MIHTYQVRAGRWYRSGAGVRCCVRRLFGRGRNRQVRYEEEGRPELEHCIPIRSFAQRFVLCCRVCGCVDADCRQCIEKTGEPCHWVEPDLCSACVGAEKAEAKRKE